MSDGPATLPDQNGTAVQKNGLITPPPPPSPLVAPPVPQNGAETLTNGAVTRNKRMCRRKTAFKEDYTTKTANQIKSLRLKSTAASRTPRIPKLPPKPCKAGTNVVVKAKVLQEVPEGILVMSIQWRGKEYCGCFIDSSKQGWALPRFDDPKVSSIAFLTKKAQLLASDIDDSTDDDYSPKTKRKRAAKGKKSKKRKVKNGDTSNGKTVKTPTKAKTVRASATDKRRQISETQIDKPETPSEKTIKSSGKISEPEKPVLEVVVKIEPPAVTCTPEKTVEKQSVIVKTEAGPSRCFQSTTESPAQTTPKQIRVEPPKQIWVEKTATIPVGSISSSLLLKQPTIPRTINSPFSTSPSTPINGALVSPLHNHSFPLMVPPPFFIPNFLQSAKFLAEGAKRTQSSDSNVSSSIPGSDFNSMFAKNSVTASSSGNGASIMSDSLNQLRNKMT